jgi:DNA-binding MarR family transcriptional regulator
MNTPEILDNPADFDLENFLPYRLSLLSNTVSQGIAEAYQKDHDLSVTEWRVVAVLGRFQGSTASEVVERTAMDKVAVSRAVKSLMEKGLVQRRTDKADRRRRQLFLTRGRGRRLLGQIVPMAKNYERGILEALNPDEFVQLDGLIGKLQRVASEINHRMPEVSAAAVAVTRQAQSELN